MNSTEQKIREAYERKFGKDSWDVVPSTLQAGFMYGYRALLNELVPQGEWNTFQNGLDIELRRTTVYTLPEGVTKCFSQIKKCAILKNCFMLREFAHRTKNI